MFTEIASSLDDDLVIIEQKLVELERQPADRQVCDAVITAMGAMVGVCKAVGLPGTESLIRRGRGWMVATRDGRRKFDAAAADAMLGWVDSVRIALRDLAANGVDADHRLQPRGSTAPPALQITSLLCSASASATPTRQALESSVRSSLSDTHPVSVLAVSAKRSNRLFVMLVGDRRAVSAAFRRMCSDPLFVDVAVIFVRDPEDTLRSEASRLVECESVDGWSELPGPRLYSRVVERLELT